MTAALVGVGLVLLVGLRALAAALLRPLALPVPVARGVATPHRGRPRPARGILAAAPKTSPPA
jgi:hypothetical protein